MANRRGKGGSSDWCLQTVVLEKTPESPLESKEIKSVNLKGNQSWIPIGLMLKLKAPVFWLSDVNCWLIGKVPGAGKDQGQKEKRISEYEMVGQHHQCNEHELGQTLGDGEGQRGLVCSSPCSCKELDMTGQLNNNNNKVISSALNQALTVCNVTTLRRSSERKATTMWSFISSLRMWLVTPSQIQRNPAWTVC